MWGSTTSSDAYISFLERSEARELELVQETQIGAVQLSKLLNAPFLLHKKRFWSSDEQIFIFVVRVLGLKLAASSKP